LSKFSEQVITLSPDEIVDFCGCNDERVREIENRLGARIILRGNEIKIIGEPQAVSEATALVKNLLDVQRKNGTALSKQHLRVALNSTKRSAPEEVSSVLLDRIQVPSKRRHISPLTPGQKKYVDAIRTCDIVMGIGPAGTGKTYLAVAMAVTHLLSGAVSRIILVRPAVEAG
jgi:phosphate starvation-inducible PhoH-like protein